MVPVPPLPSLSSSSLSLRRTVRVGERRGCTHAYPTKQPYSAAGGATTLFCIFGFLPFSFCPRPRGTGPGQSECDQHGPQGHQLSASLAIPNLSPSVSGSNRFPPYKASAGHHSEETRPSRNLALPPLTPLPAIQSLLALAARLRLLAEAEAEAETKTETDRARTRAEQRPEPTTASNPTPGHATSG